MCDQTISLLSASFWKKLSVLLSSQAGERVCIYIHPLSEHLAEANGISFSSQQRTKSNPTRLNINIQGLENFLQDLLTPSTYSNSNSCRCAQVAVFKLKDARIGDMR